VACSGRGAHGLRCAGPSAANAWRAFPGPSNPLPSRVAWGRHGRATCVDRIVRLVRKTEPKKQEKDEL
jgi:hypothetical protein